MVAIRKKAPDSSTNFEFVKSYKKLRGTCMEEEDATAAAAAAATSYYYIYCCMNARSKRSLLFSAPF